MCCESQMWKCIEYDIPLLGICAGFNNILRALGTDVVEDKTNSHNHYKMDYRHTINLVEDSLLYILFQLKSGDTKTSCFISDLSRLLPSNKQRFSLS